MKIDNLDLLKQWLVNVLNPIFDGDPEKLALYIVALAKKVEDDQASRDRCIDDLEVFLETNTKKFVDSLFETLISKKYLTNPGTSSTNSPAAEAGPSSNTTEQGSTNSTLTSINNNDNNNKNNDNNNSNSNDKDNIVKLSEGGRSRYNNESNSRYDQRDQRSRRFNDSESSSSNQRRSGADNRGGGGTNFNRGRLTRDYEEMPSRGGGSRFNNTDSGRERHKNRSRTRIHRGTDSTSSSSSDEDEYRRTRRSFSRSRSNSPRNGDHVNNKKRCRDFDEKGFCTMAEYCPYDHGEAIIAPAAESNKQDQDNSSHNNQNLSNSNTQNQQSNSNYAQQAPKMGQHHNQHKQQQGQFGHQHHRGGRGGMRMNNNRMNCNNPINNPMMGINQGGPMFNPNVQSPMGGGMPPNSNDFQQRQMMMSQQQGNRSRNLVSIVGHGQEPSNMGMSGEMGNNSYQGGMQRGMKRSYNNLNTPMNDPNFNYNKGPMGMPGGHGGPHPQGPMNMPGLQQQQQNEFNPSGALLPNPPLMANPNQMLHQMPQQQFINKPNFNNQMNLMHNQGQQHIQQQVLPIHHHQQQQQQQQLQQQQLQQHQQQQHQQQQQQNTNTQLVLRKVPLDMNRPEIIRGHFMRFGQILDIQCKYDNLTDATLIRFANNQQAFAAFRSPESILNNRFIRIHWLNHHQRMQNQQNQSQNQNIQQQQQQQHQQQPPQQQQPESDEPLVKRHVKDRLGQIHSNPNSNQDLLKNKENDNQTADKTNVAKESVVELPDSTTTAKNKEDSIEKQEQQQAVGGQVLNNFNSMTLKQGQERQAKLNELASIKAIEAENQKKLQQIKLQVTKCARELMQKQIKEQKILLTRFEQSKNVNEKQEILDLVKTLNESIEKQKTILINNNAFDEHPTDANNSNKSPFSFQKANPSPQVASAPKSIPAPPHSLKLNNVRHTQTNFLKNQQQAAYFAAQALRQSNQGASKDLPVHSSPSSLYSKASVDNRPKQLIITGVENVQEKEAILNFVNAIGCQVEHASEAEKNETTDLFSFVLSFYSRKDAEIALAKCSYSLTSKTISITWHKADTASDLKPSAESDKTDEANPSIGAVEEKSETVQSLTADTEASTAETVKTTTSTETEATNVEIVQDTTTETEAPNVETVQSTAEETKPTERDPVDALFDSSGNSSGNAENLVQESNPSES